MRNSSTGQTIIDLNHTPVDLRVIENVKNKRKGNAVTFNAIREAYGLPPILDDWSDASAAEEDF
jgi:hypothetical protein